MKLSGCYIFFVPINFSTPWWEVFYPTRLYKKETDLKPWTTFDKNRRVKNSFNHFVRPILYKMLDVNKGHQEIQAGSFPNRHWSLTTKAYLTTNSHRRISISFLTSIQKITMPTLIDWHKCLFPKKVKIEILMCIVNGLSFFLLLFSILLLGRLSGFGVFET